jgi:predicted XRE-type DNA-binding protein
MKANEAVREIMNTQEIKIATLASRLNIKHNVMSERLRQNNISIDKLNEMLRALDYKIMVVPRSSRVPDGGFEIE